MSEVDATSLFFHRQNEIASSPQERFLAKTVILFWNHGF
jgi:hypothetical protein